MAKKFVKLNSRIFLIFFIGLIAASFMFTGYENMVGTPDVIATVGNLPIKINEYENEFQRQLSLYRNFTNNKDLTAQQIKQYRIKENVLNNLIEHRLWVKLAQSNNLNVSESEVVDKIKQQSWFLTDKKFDFEKYKSLLRANGMTTAYFETLMGRDTLNALSKKIFSHHPVSKAYMEKINYFKNQKIAVHAVEIQKNSLRKHLKITRSEVNLFLKDPKNLQYVEKQLKKRKADKKSKIKDQKFSLAKELIQNSSSKEKNLRALTDRLVKKLQTLLNANKTKTIESLKKKYSLKMDKNITIDHFNGSKGVVKISEKNLKTIFKDGLTKRRTYLFEENGIFVLIRAFQYVTPKKPRKSKNDSESLAKKQKKEQETTQYAFQRKLSRSIIDKLKKEISIKTYKTAL